MSTELPLSLSLLSFFHKQVKINQVCLTTRHALGRLATEPGVVVAAAQAVTCSWQQGGTVKRR